MVRAPSKQPAAVPLSPGLRLAGEELSCGGHLGTQHCPEHPAPHPHRLSSFLPFSSLINHMLLPHLNMELPSRETQLSPRRGGCPAQWWEHRGLAPLWCV